MTEKRFVETLSTGIVTDTITKKEYRCEMRIDEDLLELLNELHEENQSSKEFIEQLQEELVLFKEAGKNMGIDLNAQITALKQENEQLKKILNDTVSQLDAEISDDYSRYSVRVVVDSVMFRRIKEICR